MGRRGVRIEVSKKDTERRAEMNKAELESVMKLYGDTGISLSAYLGIARTTFSAKINETNGAEFTQSEIMMIKEKYNLSADDVDRIFFTIKCRKKTQ